MQTATEDPDLSMILADMRFEFLETTQDRLDEIDQCLERMLRGSGRVDNEVLEIKRLVHGIKGTGATFGFPTVTMVAHSLEDYFETAGDIGDDELHDIQLYVDRIREIVDGSRDPEESAAHKIMRGLPSKPGVVEDSIRVGETSVLMVMPRGVQRKIIGRELATFGFRVVIADDTIDAIKIGMIVKPEIVVASLHVSPFTGAELAGVMASIRATRGARFLLVTADAADAEALPELPETVTVVRKGTDFSRDFFQFLRKHGFN